MYVGKIRAISRRRWNMTPLFGLDRRDLDLDDGVLTVERVFSQGVLKDCKKSSRQRRRVPLRGRVVDAIARMPPRIDTLVLFPAPRGGRIDLEKFRARAWAPALRAADVPHRRVYDMRHTFASWAIAGGISTSPRSWARRRR